MAKKLSPITITPGLSVDGSLHLTISVRGRVRDVPRHVWKEVYTVRHGSPHHERTIASRNKPPFKYVLPLEVTDETILVDGKPIPFEICEGVWVDPTTLKVKEASTEKETDNVDVHKEPTPEVPDAKESEGGEEPEPEPAVKKVATKKAATKKTAAKKAATKKPAAKKAAKKED